MYAIKIFKYSFLIGAITLECFLLDDATVLLLLASLVCYFLYIFLDLIEACLESDESKKQEDETTCIDGLKVLKYHDQLEELEKQTKELEKAKAALEKIAEKEEQVSDFVEEQISGFVRATVESCAKAIVDPVLEETAKAMKAEEEQNEKIEEETEKAKI